MTDHPRRPVSAAPITATVHPDRHPPAPIRVDREQLDEALKPVTATIAQMAIVFRESVAPALAALGVQLERIAKAVEAQEQRATRNPPNRRTR